MSRHIITAFAVCLALGLFADQALSNARTDDPLGVAVSPQNLLLSSDQGGAVTVHTSIPYGSVDCASLTLSGVPVVFTKADDCGNLVARFSETAVKAIVSPPEAVLTLSGILKTGEAFSGSDTVQVRP